MSELGKGRLATLAMFSPLVIYLLALNPWFVPDQHDDVLYYFGAVALLDGVGFSLGGTPITDWPPGFPVALATAMGIFGKSVWIAKLVVLGFVAFGIMMSYSVARIYGLPAPRAVAALTGLLPISLISGAAVLSEWPYLAVSMAFLWALHRLGEVRTYRWALVVGALLAMASLTRFIGVFLGVAIVVQAWGLWRRGGFRAVLPEALAALIGAVVWLAWKLRCNAVIAAGNAPTGAYDNWDYYLGRFNHIEPQVLFERVEAVLFSFGKVTTSVLGTPIIGTAMALLCGVALISGAAMRLRKGGLSPAGGYVLVCLLLLLGDLNKPERYFLPLAPFLIGYVMTSLQTVTLPRVATIGVAAWMAWLLALDAYLLFVGNGERSRGGFSTLATADEREFNRGESRELYDALRWADENAQESGIGASGFHGKYVLAYTGRDYRSLPDESVEGLSVLIGRTGELPENWEIWKEFGTYSVCRRSVSE